MKWLKRISLGLVVSLVMGCSSYSLTEGLNTETYSGVTDNFVDIAYQVEAQGGTGSGFWVDKNTFITACHVVGRNYLGYHKNKETGELELTEWFEVAEVVNLSNTDGSKRLNAQVISCDQDQDLAILKTLPGEAAEVENYLPLYHGQVPQGTLVFGGGYPLGWRLTITHGLWQGPIMANSKYINFYRHTAPTMFGDSGSALIAYLEGKWQIVGIRQAIRSTLNGQMPVSHLGIATDGVYIQAHIDKHDLS